MEVGPLYFLKPENQVLARVGSSWTTSCRCSLRFPTQPACTATARPVETGLRPVVVLPSLRLTVFKESGCKRLTHPGFCVEDHEGADIDVFRLGGLEVDWLLVECPETLRLALAESGMRRCIIDLLTERLLDRH